MPPHAGEAALSSSRASLASRRRAPLYLVIGSATFWLFITLSSIAIFPLAVLIRVLSWPLDPKLRVLHQFTCLWASLYTWLNPWWRVRVAGRAKVQPGVAYVMVANHQSLADILVLFRLFVHFKWVSKVENFRVPCIGWNMALNRYIKLRRGDTASIAEMMRNCEATMKQGSSIMMFPEGTRSLDGRLRPFKHGAFTLAKRRAAPILPIVIEGTGNALPKAGLVLQGRHPITLRVLDPIEPSSFEGESAEQLSERVRAVFQRELGQG